MTHYEWTIEVKSRRPIRKVTTVRKMEDVLRICDLPGVAPPNRVLLEAGYDEHGSTPTTKATPTSGL